MNHRRYSNFELYIYINLIRDALEFAGCHVEISPDEEDLIMHVRKSLLFYKNLPWAKKQGNLFECITDTNVSKR